MTEVDAEAIDLSDLGRLEAPGAVQAARARAPGRGGEFDRPRPVPSRPQIAAAVRRKQTTVARTRGEKE